MTTPKRYLFAIIDGGGTVPADTSVIRAMVDRGHDVRVLADRVLAPDIERTGAEHVVWDRAPQRPNLDPQSVIMKDWDAKTPFEAFGRVRDGAMVGPAALFAADVRSELQRRPADVVVGELLRLRRPDRCRGRGRAVRVPRVESAVVPRVGDTAARPGSEARTWTARTRPRRRAQPGHGAAVRQGSRSAQRGETRQRARANRIGARELRAGGPAAADDEQRVRVRELHAAAERPSCRSPSRRPRVGWRVGRRQRGTSRSCSSG